MAEEHRWRINVMIRHLALRHRHAIQRRLESELGLHQAQELVLLALHRRGPMVQKDLLNYLSVEAPTLSTILSRLDKTGLIDRVQSETDRRAQVISLTAEGSEMIPRIFRIENEVAEQVTTGLSADQVEQWIEVMRLGLRNLDGEDAHRWTDDLIVSES